MVSAASDSFHSLPESTTFGKRSQFAEGTYLDLGKTVVSRSSDPRPDLALFEGKEFDLEE